MESVKRVSDVLFGGSDFTDLDEQDIEALAAEIPTVSIGVSLVEALQQAGFAASGGEARRLVVAGAVSVDGSKVDVDTTLVQPGLIKKGKNSFILVR